MRFLSKHKDIGRERGEMTREEAKAIRIRIQDLLDQCEGCKYVSVAFASTHVCPKCPIGQQLQELGGQLVPTFRKRNKKKVTKLKKRKNGWTDEQRRFVLENKGKLTYKEMAKILGRTESAVKRQVIAMKQKEMLHA
jgi:hypothetical protein